MIEKGLIQIEFGLQLSVCMQQQHVKLILKYLKDHDCIESLLTVQRQTNISLFTYGKQLDFLRKILLKGDFSEAISFLLTFQNRMDEKELRRMVLDVYRQKLYELIEDPQQEQLRKLFEKDIVGYCSEEEFQELFNYLTYRSVREIEGLERWTPLRGRYECFLALLPPLEMLNSVFLDQRNLPTERLENIIETYYSGKDVPGKTQKENGAFVKNKSNAVGVRTQAEDEGEKRQVGEKEKETIKNSIINMNLSGNYSQLKGKSNLYSNPNPNPNPKSTEEETKEKPFVQKPLQGEKSSAFDRNPSNISASNVSDRRPRVNASLNGPMNNQKMENSVKIDNYLRNDPPSDDNIPAAPTRSNKPLDKPQQNLSKVIQHQPIMDKSIKDSPQYRRQDNPVLLNHLQDLSSSELNEISEEERSQTTKSVKYDKERPDKQREREKEKNPSKPAYLLASRTEQLELQQEIRRNIEYLQQTSSVIYRTREQQAEKENFTFSQGGARVKQLTKLGVVSDSKAIRTCQFSPSGAYFAVGTNSSVLKIFDVQRLYDRNKYQQLTPLYQIDALHQKSIFCLDWSRTERALLTCSNDLHIKLTELGKNFNEHRSTVVGKHDSCVRMVRFGGEGRVVSCGDDSVVKVWDTGKLKRCTTLRGHASGVSGIKLHNQNQIYSVSKDMTIRRWDLRTGDTTATSKSQDSQLTYIASNTDRIVVAHRDGTVSFFTAGLQLEHAVQVHEEEVRSVQALRGEQALLTASFDGHVALFSQATAHAPNYFQHNDAGDDKVVFATFLHSTQFRGFASTSTLGLCHLYSYE